MMEGLFFAWAFVWVICGFVGMLIADKKDAGTQGFILGLLFGPLGVIIACFMDGRPECPHCRERLYRKAGVCPSCHRDVYWLGGEQYGSSVILDRVRKESMERTRIEDERYRIQREQDRERARKMGEAVHRGTKQLTSWLKQEIPKFTMFSKRVAVSAHNKTKPKVTQLAGNAKNAATSFRSKLASMFPETETRTALLKWFFRGVLATALTLPVVWWAQSPSHPPELSSTATAEVSQSIKHDSALMSESESPSSLIHTVFPGDDLFHVSKLHFHGRGEDRNEINKIDVDCEFEVTNGTLKMGSGSSAALILLPDTDDLIGAISGDLAGTGNIFFLLGWKESTGYLLYNMSLRSQGYWRLVYIENGKAVPDTFQQLSPFRMINPGRLVVEVTNGRLTTWFEGAGKTIMAHELDLPNYKTGMFIFGTGPNQYGPKQLVIRKIETSGL